MILSIRFVGRAGLLLLGALLASACGSAGSAGDADGGVSTSDGGSSDGALRDVTSSGDTLVVPAECASSKSGATPLEISFRFVNEGSAPLWVGSTCSRPQ